MMYGAQSMVTRLESVVVKHPRDAFISQEHLEQNWKAFNYTECPDYEKVLEEFARFEDVLKRHVPEVLYSPRSDAVGLDSIYTHDPVKITSKGAILMNMGKSLRHRESEVLKTWLPGLGVPILGRIEAPGRMEGGDLVWLDERTLAVGLGYRTNREGLQQLKALTSGMVDRYIEVPLPHADGPNECLHLMSLVSMIDRDLAVVYSRYMPVFFRDSLISMGIELIEVSDKEYETLGSNVLTLAPRKCLFLYDNTETSRKMKAAGVEVFEYTGNHLSIKGTGGPTCLTCPVLRTG
jgi:arginine deiminase